MIDDLMWLEELLEARGRVAGDIHRRKIRARPLVSPYVADEPDGALVASTENFRQGRSWWADPGLTASRGFPGLPGKPPGLMATAHSRRGRRAATQPARSTSPPRLQSSFPSRPHRPRYRYEHLWGGIGEIYKL